MENELNEYANGVNKSRKLLYSMENKDFSSMDYNKMKDTVLFKYLGLTTLQNYVNSKNIEKSESVKLYQRIYNLIKLTVIQAETKNIKETEFFLDSKHVINYDKIIKVKLFPYIWLRLVENNLISDKPKENV